MTAVLNILCRRTIMSISGHDGPQSIVLSPDSTRLYVAEKHALAIPILSVVNAAVISRVALGHMPNELAVGRSNKGLVADYARARSQGRAISPI